MDFSAYYNPATDTFYFQGQSYTRQSGLGLRDLISSGAREWVANPDGDGLVPRDEIEHGYTTEDYLADLEQSAWDLLKQVRDLRDRLS